MSANEPKPEKPSQARWMESVRQALIEGELSGEPRRFDFAAFKRLKVEKRG